MASPSDVLLAGVELLDELLAPHGFRFEFRGADRGSGGEFAWGEYVRGERRLELHFRYSLGLVAYRVGGLWIAHEPYLRALGTPRGANEYPGFSDDPLDGFRHLARDLGRFCAEFLAGDAAVLRRAAPAEMARLEAEHRARQAAYEGDERKRQEARDHFRAGEYGRVVALLGGVRYPDRLTESERRMLDVARRRAGGLTLH